MEAPKDSVEEPLDLRDPESLRKILTKAYSGTTDAVTPYELQLQPAVLPNQEPRMLPLGVVVDLSPAVVTSQVPPEWANRPARRDILFSPRGTVIGSPVAMGLVHFLVAEVGDVELGYGAGNTSKDGDEALITLTTQTGNVSTPPVGPVGDPYLYAETGKVAK